jgi:hypothetical protein
MPAFSIGNLNNPPLNNINGSLVNVDSSSVANIPFSSSTIPSGPHTLPPPGSNIQGAAGIYPLKGGKNTCRKINRRKINKISRHYKMKGSKRTIKRRVRRMKSRVRSFKRRSSRRKRGLRGGAFQSPMTTPNYSAGHSQYMNNNGSQSNTYSLGGQLAANSSALANPPIFNKVVGDVDNLNHNTLNANNNIGAGSGVPSRGWF